jgi:flagellar protein FlaJ
MALTKIQKHSYKIFKNIAEKRVSEKLSHSLESAHMEIRGAVYLSVAFLLMVISIIVSYVIFLILIFWLLPFMGIALDLFTTIFLLILPIIISVIAFFIYLQIPASTAKSRGKRIDIDLPYALNFVSAMSSAGVTPTEIFNSLSKQDIYGEIRDEAAWIFRDVALLGVDILTAIKNNIKRTPSEKFGEFLQGMIVTVASGGSLKSYFIAKANQFMIENRQKQKELFETLGIMAESYVTAAVAGILLLLIVIPIMMIISGDASQLNFLYLIIFIIVPLIHTGFAYAIKSMTLEV